MSASKPGPVRRFFRGAWRAVDASRRVVVNLVFLLVVLIVVFALVKSGPPVLSDKTALVLNLQGAVGEQKTGNLRSSALDQVRGDGVQKIQLRDVRRGADVAAADPKITSLVLILDELQPTGFATLREMASAIDRFRASGKKVVAWGSTYDQRQYYVAVACRRGLPAPARRRRHHRLRQPAQLLQGRARQGRRHRQPAARRHLQELRRALHRAMRRRRPRSRPRPRSTARSGRPTPTTSRSQAQAARRLDRQGHRRRAGADRRGGRRFRQVRARREAGRRPQDPRRAARDDGPARRTPTTKRRPFARSRSTTTLARSGRS